MESRITRKFKELEREEKKALITYITVGDPSLEMTEKLVLTLEKAGADIIELGIPYSDPLADGPIIQRASQRALAQQTNIEGIFGMVKSLRNKTKLPLIFLAYYNPIFRIGIENFLIKCQEVGIDGLIIPDLPLEERTEIMTLIKAKAFKLDLIPLVAPTSQERVQKIVAEGQGFVYCISSMGVTGLRDTLDEGLEGFLAQVKETATLPTAIGFGISNKEMVTKLKNLANGVIVGSAIVNVMEEGLQEGDLEEKVYGFVKGLRDALDS